eukprot:CAMPEP_0202883198 /NCGR_PEP_ID=MMETSP1391-20130828/39101_1 /ASSEMBLY_ACC=CAM_ASM_000867 /TAXON_ID=1034604 /ORGANISM="Chlamydomonas leiostraca, Strain SAG 11-49" /LENGTH=220 /DNA_ID=CAMNT_0049566177 /DNA_START=539 /DNA_END=1201 /DNA_ORIENTATION=-
MTRLVHSAETCQVGCDAQSPANPAGTWSVWHVILCHSTELSSIATQAPAHILGACRGMPAPSLPASSHRTPSWPVCCVAAATEQRRGDCTNSTCSQARVTLYSLHPGAHKAAKPDARCCSTPPSGSAAIRVAAQSVTAPDVALSHQAPQLAGARLGEVQPDARELGLLVVGQALHVRLEHAGQVKRQLRKAHQPDLGHQPLPVPGRHDGQQHGHLCQGVR